MAKGNFQAKIGYVMHMFRLEEKAFALYEKGYAKGCTLPDPLAALRDCHRALRPGGALLLSDLFRRADMTEGEGGPAARLACREGTSCLDGARPRAEWDGLLARAGFLLHCFEDHSPALADLAARLVWYGAGAAPHWLRGGCTCGGVSSGRGAFGYGLWIAQKECS